jgi:hypothetical protein
MRAQPGRPFVRKPEPISSGDGLPRSRRELGLSRAKAKPSFCYGHIGTKSSSICDSLWLVGLSLIA